GDLITIIYFEYLDLLPLSKDTVRSVLFDLSKTLLKLSEKNKSLIENAPDYLKTYNSHFQYYKNIKCAKRIIKGLSHNQLTIDMLEEVLNSQPLIITHGDIYQTNVFTGNYVIDWDSFGFFPFGFESALILAMQTEPLTFSELQRILIEEFKEIIADDYWDGFELSCLYFYFIFTAINKENEAQVTFQKDVFMKIEKLYYKKSCDTQINELINITSKGIL